MKRIMIICISILFSISLLGCSNKGVKQSSDKNSNVSSPTQTDNVSSENGTDSKQADTSNGQADKNSGQQKAGNLLEPLAGGKIAGVDYGIGTECSKVLTALGKPDDEGTTDGNYYYVYGKVTYFSDSIDANTGKISAIAVRDNIDICGVKVGMKPADIKNVLGKPFSEGQDEGDQGFAITYKVKDGLYLSFFSDNESSPTNAALLVLKSCE